VVSPAWLFASLLTRSFARSLAWFFGVGRAQAALPRAPSSLHAYPSLYPHGMAWVLPCQVATLYPRLLARFVLFRFHLLLRPTQIARVRVLCTLMRMDEGG
jgi:hypothetical protein